MENHEELTAEEKQQIMAKVDNFDEKLKSFIGEFFKKEDPNVAEVAGMAEMLIKKGVKLIDLMELETKADSSMKTTHMYFRSKLSDLVITGFKKNERNSTTN